MYAHIRAMIEGRPLMITRAKLDAILSGIGPRLHGAQRFDVGDDGGDYDEPLMRTDGHIAVMEIMGILTNRPMRMQPMSSSLLDYGTIRRWYQQAMQDPNVSEIVAMVDSPGGDATGCLELASYIASLRGTKPMTALVCGSAASAAYALASAHDRIVMTPSGYAGSVGVVAVHADESGANEQAGIRYTYIYAGAHKVDFNPDSPLSDDARAELQADINQSYAEFVALVARNRGLTPQAVQSTEARLYLGRAAVSAGLVDEIADPYSFIDSLSQAGDLSMPFDATMAAAIVAECNAAGLSSLAPKYITEAASGSSLDDIRARLGDAVALKGVAESADLIKAAAAAVEGKSIADVIRAAAEDIKAATDRARAEAKSQRLDVLAEVDEAADIKSQVNPGGKPAEDNASAKPVPVEKVYEFRRKLAQGD